MRIKMYVPTIGFRFQLIEDWTVRIFNEYRNNNFASKHPELAAGFEKVNRDYTANPELFGTITIPTGTVLKVDRIYIRKGAGMKEYDSVTFLVEQWGEEDEVKNVLGKPLRGRFWAKLKEVNQIVFEPYTDFTEL